VRYELNFYVLFSTHFVFKGLKYLEMTGTIENLIHEEIKRRLDCGNACYHSVQNLLSSPLLSGNVKIRINSTINLPLVLYEGETYSVILREEHRSRVFENMVLRKMFGLKRDEVVGGAENCIMRSFITCTLP
jgi:hypothetical protein